jgi:hypothetical protein
MVMPAQQSPSGDRFVVRVEPEDAPSLSRRLEELGSVEALDGTDLLLLHVSEPAADPRRVWERILDRADGAAWVAPVLIDEHGQPHLPTGEVSARFDRAPSEDDLQAFAGSHGLELRSRNEYVKEQATFRLARPRSTYLPDLVQSIGTEQGVRTAWANTLTLFRRQ